MERSEMHSKMNKSGDPSSQYFGRNLFTYSNSRVSEFSRLHPVLPQRYVQEYKTDMKNRKAIEKNMVLGGIPNFEHDESLFLGKREQVYYNVENGVRVEGKVVIPDRTRLLRPPLHSEMSRYRSSLMLRACSNDV